MSQRARRIERGRRELSSALRCWDATAAPAAPTRWRPARESRGSFSASLHVSGVSGHRVGRRRLARDDLFSIARSCSARAMAAATPARRRPLGELEAGPSSASRAAVSRPPLPFAASPGSRALALEQSQDAAAALDADTDSEPGASSPHRRHLPARAASSSALLDAFRASSLSPAKEPARSQSARQSPTALNSAARLQSALGAGGSPFSQSPGSSSGRSGTATPSSLPRTPGGQINVIALTASSMTLDDQPCPSTPTLSMLMLQPSPSSATPTCQERARHLLRRHSRMTRS